LVTQEGHPLHALAGHLPPYDTYVSVSDSDDGFDDFPDVDRWGFGFGT
jgi:hypothetical protein